VVERFRGEPNWVIVATSGGHELPLTNAPAVMQVIEAAIQQAPLPTRI
jgi:hypothetical protein